jgi:hypothetical protein
MHLNNSTAHPHFPRPSHAQGGFALVIALSLMAFVLLLLLSITTLVQVETQSAQISSTRAKAEQNALLGLQQALGVLQVSMGPDQRISATADVLSTSPSTGTEYLVGVWSSEDADNDGRADGSFKRWLVSNDDENAAGGDRKSDSINFVNQAAPIQVNGAGGYNATQSNYEVLLGGGSAAQDPNAPQIMQGVVAQKLLIQSDSGSAAGNYAWWIGDEGVKARINFTDASQNTALGPNETKQAALQTLSSSVRGNVATLTGLALIDLQSDDLASKLLDTADLTLAPSAPSEAQIKAQFHDLTTYSSGVLADAHHGGLKQDLSLAFELSDADFNNSVFGSGGPDTILSTGFGQVQPIFRLPNTTGVKANGPAWHLLRDYYTIYQRMVAPMTNPTLNAQAFLPNRAEQNPAGSPQSWEQFASQRYITDNALDGGAQGDPLRTDGGDLTIPVKASYLPYVQRHITSFALDFEAVSELEALSEKPDGTSKYPNVPVGYTNTNNYQFRKMRQVVSPSFVVHNPYNVSIRHDGIATGVAHVRFSIEVESPLDSSFDGSNRTRANQHMMKVQSGTIKPGSVQVYGGVLSEGWPAYSQPGPAKRFWDTNDHMGLEDLIIPVDPAAIGDPNLTVYYRPFDNVRWAYWMYHFIAVPGVDAPVTANLGLWSLKVNKALSNYGGQHADNIYLAYRDWYEYGGEDSGRTISTETYRVEDVAAPFPYLNYDCFVKPAEADSVANPYPYPGLTHTNPLAPIMQSRNLFPTSQAKPDYGWPMYAPNWQLNVYTTDANVPGMDALETMGGNAFWGASNDSGGSTHVAAIELPTSPPISIGQLQNANLSLYAHMPALAIGNSFASAYIQSNVTYQIFQNREGNDRIYYDLSYLSNEVLWDRYFFSSYSRAYDANADQYNGTLGDSFDIAFDSDNYAGSSSLDSLPSPRMELALEDETSADARTKLFDGSGNPRSTAYQRSAENLLVKGSFNVHSTSVNAWKAMLASARDMSIYQSGESAETDYTNNHTPLTRLKQPIAGAFDSASDSYDDDEAWGGFATLSDTQLDDLANAIVDEIKLRVANQGTIFTALSAFVNRSLSDDNFGLAGLLQAAIDKSGINSAFTGGDIEVASADLQTPAGSFPAAANILDGNGAARSTATTATANLTQGDLLQVIGSFASVRSDTFRIRSYGEALDPVSGEPNGRAWCEAIVQRTPEPVNPGAAVPSDSGYWEPQTGDSLGRKFKIIHFRWLSEDEV